MKRVACPERDDWKATAEARGFNFHTIDSERYWDERAYYAFELEEIERCIERATTEIDALCIELVNRAVDDEPYLKCLKIPEAFWSFIAESWRRHDASLYGRLDLSFGASGPAKLLEYNADTPTSIFEAAVFQWTWLEQAIERRLIPGDADQFSGFVGAITGKFLPFGEAVTELAVPGFGIVPMSVVDCANLAVFVDARSVGLHGHEGPLEIDGSNEVVARINAIRKAVADRLGLTAFTSASANPFCVIVSKPSEYRTFSSQEEVRPEAFDMLVRSYAADSVSRALPVTITSCTGAASRTPATLPHSLLSGTAHRRSHIRLGHPSGVIEVECAGTGEGEAFRLSTATVERTARRLAEGRAFLHTDPSWLAHASRDTVRR
jgi:hypothetical protein